MLPLADTRHGSEGQAGVQLVAAGRLRYPAWAWHEDKFMSNSHFCAQGSTPLWWCLPASLCLWLFGGLKNLWPLSQRLCPLNSISQGVLLAMEKHWQRHGAIFGNGKKGPGRLLPLPRDTSNYFLLLLEKLASINIRAHGLFHLIWFNSVHSSCWLHWGREPKMLGKFLFEWRTHSRC